MDWELPDSTTNLYSRILDTAWPRYSGFNPFQYDRNRLHGGVIAEIDRKRTAPQRKRKADDMSAVRDSEAIAQKKPFY